MESTKLDYQPPAEQTRPRPGIDWRRVIETLGPVIGLAMLIAFSAWRSDTFLKPENLLNILRNSSFVGILAIGMTFVIISGGIDLSVGSLLAFSGGVGIWLMNTATGAARLIAENQAARESHAQDLSLGLNLPLTLPWSTAREWLAHTFVATHLSGNETIGVAIAFLAIVCTATLAGLLNGTLITKGRVVPFIITLGGLAAYRSFALAMADGAEFRPQAPSDSTFPPISTLYSRLGSGGIRIGEPTQHIALYYPIIALALITIVSWIVLSRTRFGRYVYATGANERATVYSGINVDRIKIGIYTLMGLYTGIAALMYSSYLSSISSSSSGSLSELDAIAAVVIGGTRMQGGRGSVWGTLIGVLTIGVIANMLNLIGVSTYLQGAVKGGIIVAAVLVQRIGTSRNS